MKTHDIYLFEGDADLSFLGREVEVETHELTVSIELEESSTVFEATIVYEKRVLDDGYETETVVSQDFETIGNA